MRKRDFLLLFYELSLDLLCRSLFKLCLSDLNSLDLLVGRKLLAGGVDGLSDSFLYSFLCETFNNQVFLIINCVKVVGC